MNNHQLYHSFMKAPLERRGCTSKALCFARQFKNNTYILRPYQLGLLTFIFKVYRTSNFSRIFVCSSCISQFTIEMRCANQARATAINSLCDIACDMKNSFIVHLP